MKCLKTAKNEQKIPKMTTLSKYHIKIKEPNFKDPVLIGICFKVPPREDKSSFKIRHPSLLRKKTTKINPSGVARRSGRSSTY
tara:strand:- start:344 stop:592 length:249 start_codon:yes stop_codon:yes gene_type:complete